jgi:hypothetical protein
MFVNKVPRSVWPKGCFKITAWHKDEHISALMRSKDGVNAECGLAPGTETLPPDVIASLVERAINATDVYRATACLEPLYDAFESLLDTVIEFERRFHASTAKQRRRISCCLGYLLQNGQNRRDPVGRHYSVVKNDHEHFKGLWMRARKLNELLDSSEA